MVKSKHSVCLYSVILKHLKLRMYLSIYIIYLYHLSIYLYHLSIYIYHLSIYIYHLSIYLYHLYIIYLSIILIYISISSIYLSIYRGWSVYAIAKITLINQINSEKSYQKGKHSLIANFILKLSKRYRTGLQLKKTTGAMLTSCHLK